MCYDRLTLKRFLENGLTLGTTRETAAHLLDCGRCKDRLNKLNDIQVYHEPIPSYVRITFHRIPATTYGLASGRI